MFNSRVCSQSTLIISWYYKQAHVQNTRQRSRIQISCTISPRASCYMMISILGNKTNPKPHNLHIKESAEPTKSRPATAQSAPPLPPFSQRYNFYFLLSVISSLSFRRNGWSECIPLTDRKQVGRFSFSRRHWNHRAECNKHTINWPQDFVPSIQGGVEARWLHGQCSQLQIKRFGFKPWPGTLCWVLEQASCSASLHLGVQMGTSEFNADGHRAMDCIPS